MAEIRQTGNLHIALLTIALHLGLGPRSKQISEPVHQIWGMTLIEIEEAAVVPPDKDDITGRVTDGFIKLTGILFGFHTVSKAANWFELRTEDKTVIAQMVYLDVHPPPGQDVCDLLSLPIRVTMAGDAYTIEGLLLETAFERSNTGDHFRRVGYFRTSHKQAPIFNVAINRTVSIIRKQAVIEFAYLARSIILV